MILAQFLNFGLISRISFISALRGLGTSPNIFKWWELSFHICIHKAEIKFWDTFSLIRLPRAP